MKLGLAGAATLPLLHCGGGGTPEPPPTPTSSIFAVSQIPDHAVTAGNHHVGVDALLDVMARNGLPFHGLIAANDVVLIKVNAQWRYRGCTNSDVVRGVIQRILEHPEGFRGEVVIVENGQGRGSLACDASTTPGVPDIQANAEDPSHSFAWLVDSLFRDPRVSMYLLDPIGNTFIADDDHQTDGYRRLEDVSYPCFTTRGGHHVELARGVWNGTGFDQNLKLINIPVLKHHDVGGSEITGALKHVYGLLSMGDGQSSYRHYAGLGPTCGKMMVAVRAPILHIMDAIWVSHASLAGAPPETTTHANQLAASQDPVALDYWAARHILAPIDDNPNHDPDYPGIAAWLTAAMSTINDRGGLSGAGMEVAETTNDEALMAVHAAVM